MNITNLKEHNTFGIDADCKKISFIRHESDIKPLLEDYKTEKILILGGGSNVLFINNYFDGVVLLNQIKGFEILNETQNEVSVKVGAGEVWHEFVLKCIENNFGGVENLSLIPGSVGASPMQNIGAYGVEIKDIFESLEAYHIATSEIHTFSKEECAFGYRESVFKRKLKDQYIITSVTFKLTRNHHQLNTSYGVIEDELTKKEITHPTIKDVSDAIIAIRSSKLPNPKDLGNAGSFFKNPVIDKKALEKIKITFPEVPSYNVNEKHVKLPAGWLIEKTGWKGKVLKNYGVHKLQALVLVNYGGATGKEIYQLSTDIIEDVKSKFGVELEREVNMIL